jgi:hypothetical protein
MSTSAGPGDTSGTLPAPEVYAGDDERGYGWVAFAGVMLAMAGVLNFIYGIAAVDNSKFFINDAEFVASDLNTWGWFLLVVGAVQILSAIGIWAQAAGARWVGILSAAVNALLQMIVISGYPYLSVALFAIDILVIYGLLAHGRRTAV